MSPRVYPQLPLVLASFLIIGLLIYGMRKRRKKNPIAQNFDLSEFDAENAPEQVKKNITELVKNVLQPLRDGLKNPVKITSGYRDAAKNEEVGGVKDSQHITGNAADIAVMNKSLEQIFNYIIANLPFDVLILYKPGARGYKYGGIHVSYKQNPRYITKIKTQ